MTPRDHARLILRRLVLSLVSEGAKAAGHLVQVVTSHVDAAACIVRDGIDAERPKPEAAHPPIIFAVPGPSDRRAN